MSILWTTLHLYHHVCNFPNHVLNLPFDQEVHSNPAIGKLQSFGWSQSDIIDTEFLKTHTHLRNRKTKLNILLI